ncbi:DnaJ domain-containing protein [Archangium violaceum]|uniref:DnaJ domain-containing protein n=1 Tax=Archangium violaceum TaxID=83451 RepID=UPI00126A4A08|nr:DnaJ domain-containing protein [Archangium violaceum]
MPNLDSCYALLGLSRGASQEELRDAFHRVAKQLYTDPSGPDTTARLQTIAEAYSRLEVASSGQDSAVSPGPSPRWLWRLCGHISSALACGGVRLLGDGTVELCLQEDEALTGGVATLSFDTDIVCRRCSATPGAGCERCAGTGRERERVSFWLSIPARVANGTVLHPSVEPLKLAKPISFIVRVSRTR